MTIRDESFEGINSWLLPDGSIEVYECEEDGELEVYVDVPMVVQTYIENCMDIDEINDILMLVTRQKRNIERDMNNPGRASEWDVLGSK